MTANKWGLVATILALVGLGFAAMSINPPFAIPSWVPSIFFVAAGITLLWLIILLRKNKKNKQIEAIKPERELKIGAKVQGVRSYGYYDKAEGTGGKERDKEITVEAILSPSKPTTMSKISLELWGQKFDSETGMHIVETTMILLLVFSHIPNELAINTQNARICALSTDGSEIYSEPFPIIFSGA